MNRREGVPVTLVTALSECLPDQKPKFDSSITGRKGEILGPSSILLYLTNCQITPNPTSKYDLVKIFVCSLPAFHIMIITPNLCRKVLYGNATILNMFFYTSIMYWVTSAVEIHVIYSNSVHSKNIWNSFLICCQTTDLSTSQTIQYISPFLFLLQCELELAVVKGDLQLFAAILSLNSSRLSQLLE